MPYHFTCDYWYTLINGACGILVITITDHKSCAIYQDANQAYGMLLSGNNLSGLPTVNGLF